MAEGVFRHLVDQEGYGDLVEIDSAGTHAYHIGEPPDARAQTAAAKRGVDIGALRGRQATAIDLRRFDFVLAMDRENATHLREICPEGMEHKIQLFLEYAPGRMLKEVPDPYFGGRAGFDRVLDMIEEAAAGLLAHIRQSQSP
jgi:protein-tyrosine phosphatase